MVFWLLLMGLFGDGASWRRRVMVNREEVIVTITASITRVWSCVTYCLVQLGVYIT